MVRPTRVVISEESHPLAMSLSDAQGTGPTVSVDGDFVLDGEWILRRYSNDREFERLRLMRRRSQVIGSAEVEPPKAARRTRIEGPRSNVVITQQPDVQRSTAQPTQEKPSQTKPAAVNSAGRSNSQDNAPVTSRQVVYLAAFNKQGKETSKKGAQVTRNLFDPGTEMPSPKKTRNPFVEKPKVGHTSSLIATGGHVRAEKGKKGTWHFQTSGGDRYDNSDEYRASQQMGNKGHWEPDTSHPTAEDIHNFRECFRSRGKTDTDSAGINIVWVETEESPSDHEEASQPENQDHEEGEVDQNVDEPDKPVAPKNAHQNGKASKSGNKPSKVGGFNPAGLDFYSFRLFTNRAKTTSSSQAADERDNPAVAEDEVAETQDRIVRSPAGTKRKASATNADEDHDEPEPGSSRFHTLNGANGAYVDEADGSPPKRQRVSGEPVEESGSSPLSEYRDYPDSPPSRSEGKARLDEGDEEEEDEAGAVGETAANPEVIDSDGEDSE